MFDGASSPDIPDCILKPSIESASILSIANGARSSNEPNSEPVSLPTEVELNLLDSNPDDDPFRPSCAQVMGINFFACIESFSIPTEAKHCRISTIPEPISVGKDLTHLQEEAMKEALQAINELNFQNQQRLLVVNAGKPFHSIPSRALRSCNDDEDLRPSEKFHCSGRTKGDSSATVSKSETLFKADCNSCMSSSLVHKASSSCYSRKCIVKDWQTSKVTHVDFPVSMTKSSIWCHPTQIKSRIWCHPTHTSLPQNVFPVIRARCRIWFHQIQITLPHSRYICPLPRNLVLLKIFQPQRKQPWVTKIPSRLSQYTQRLASSKVEGKPSMKWTSREKLQLNLRLRTWDKAFNGLQFHMDFLSLREAASSLMALGFDLESDNISCGC
ncbi:uncharacterized protein G2W53_006412 [Senna tora]|uniref:Uncharacterized protein n=1 Tax=Senna tora TaxID=362788 RepID=A0A835CER5_9FABA|nr:uncharacterized protein G2W53_006412 [Senna tora]